jgi:hypothetical protein
VLTKGQVGVYFLRHPQALLWSDSSDRKGTGAPSTFDAPVRFSAETSSALAIMPALNGSKIIAEQLELDLVFR